MTRRRAPATAQPVITAADIQARWRATAEALPRETRQRFLDAIWAGQTIGAARDAAGITLEAALGVMNMNIMANTNLSLNREAV